MLRLLWPHLDPDTGGGKPRPYIRNKCMAIPILDVGAGFTPARLIFLAGIPPDLQIGCASRIVIVDTKRGTENGSSNPEVGQ